MNESNTFDVPEPGRSERVGTRRDAIRDLARMGAGAGALALPFGLAALASRVAAQVAVPVAVADALNLALRLEYLQAELYATATAPNSTIVFPSVATRTTFAILRDHEAEHVELLRAALGAQAQPKPAFDFTYGGEFEDVFSDYETFLTVATGLEDAGVRAYKSQFPALIGNSAALRLALAIHSVEARHASKVRRITGSYGVQGWILGSQANAPAAFAPIYAGEDTTMQAGINVPDVAGPVATAEDVTEAFDEPLPMATLLGVVSPFLVP